MKINIKQHKVKWLGVFRTVKNRKLFGFKFNILNMLCLFQQFKNDGHKTAIKMYHTLSTNLIIIQK